LACFYSFDEALGSSLNGKCVVATYTCGSEAANRRAVSEGSFDVHFALNLLQHRKCRVVTASKRTSGVSADRTTNNSMTSSSQPEKTANNNLPPPIKPAETATVIQAADNSAGTGDSKQDREFFNSLNDTTSIVAVLIAALPWAVLAQPVLEPHWSKYTVFNLAATCSSLSIVLALVCQADKLARITNGPSYAVIPDEIPNGANVASFYATRQLLFVNILFFFLTIAGYALPIGLAFACCVGFLVVAQIFDACMGMKSILRQISCSAQGYINEVSLTARQDDDESIVMGTHRQDRRPAAQPNSSANRGRWVNFISRG
jgi:hypothetical protein